MHNWHSVYSRERKAGRPLVDVLAVTMAATLEGGQLENAARLALCLLAAEQSDELRRALGAKPGE